MYAYSHDAVIESVKRAAGRAQAARAAAQAAAAALQSERDAAAGATVAGHTAQEVPGDHAPRPA